MVKPRTPKTAAAATAPQRLQAQLAEEDGGTALGAPLRPLVEFWSCLRDILSANSASIGLEALDELAASAILQDGLTPAKLTKTVLLLGDPNSMSPAPAVGHNVFSPSTILARTKSVKKRSPRAVKTPSAKRQKKSSSLPFDVPEDTPAKVVKDLRQIDQTAFEQGKTPAQVAYPWAGKRAWYDPQEREDLHLAHWRFMMRYRALFFLLALYAPSTDSQGRRKQKSNAIKARLQFLSRNIEEFGWYGFLDRFENTIHDTLMWFGGKPAKHSTSAKVKAKEDPPPEDLAALYRDDPAQYSLPISRVLDPHRVDEDGYSSIPELLEQTRALDFNREPHLRLSDLALARIVLDINSEVVHRDSWVGNRNKGIWKELITNSALRKVQSEVSSLLAAGKPVAVYNQRPYKDSERHSYDSDYRFHGLSLIKAPDAPITLGGPHFVDPQHKGRLALAGLNSSDDSDNESTKHAEDDGGESDKETDASDTESIQELEDEEEEKAPISTATKNVASGDESDAD